MCHESSGSALAETIGIGKGSVSLDDFENADLIIVVGQNPGTNHPRMLSVLEKAKANGAKIIAINPLPEAGLLRFKNPQKVHGVLGAGVAIADDFLQIRLGGDLALFQGLAKLLLEADDRHPGSVLDREFIDAHCAGFDDYADHISNVDLDAVVEATGLAIAQIGDGAGTDRRPSGRSSAGRWASPSTRHAVATIQRCVNAAAAARKHRQARRRRVPGARALQRPGRPDHGHLGEDARVVPGRARRRVRHHQPARARPRHRRRRSGRCATARRPVFFAMGGNFVAATPDTEVTEAALRSCSLTVQVSTSSTAPTSSPANRADPAVARPHREGRTRRREASGHRRGLDVGRAPLPRRSAAGQRAPAQRGGDRLRTRAGAARDRHIRCRGRSSPTTTTASATASRAWCRASRTSTRGCASPAASCCRTRRATSAGSKHPPASQLHRQRAATGCPCRRAGCCCRRCAVHDQYNTTIYGLDDRYRGVKGGRRVVFVNPDDIGALGFADGDRVDLISEWGEPDGTVQERWAKDFRLVPYSTPRGNAAAYYPETNPLIPLNHVARTSNTPVSKAVTIRLERHS